MKHDPDIGRRSMLLATAIILLALCAHMIQADTGTCGGASTTIPFTDVSSSNMFFCAIAQAYFTGLSNGTSATTYGPSTAVPREQMAAFITRTQDSAIKRSNRRAALEQWWTPALPEVLRPADLGSGSGPHNIVSDGADLWVANSVSGTVSRVRASDGRLLQTWTGASDAESLIACAGRIYITGDSTPGKIYVINPESAAAGTVTEFESDIGGLARQITFDGTYLWTANAANISRIKVDDEFDITFSTGLTTPSDILWDGANLWVTDTGDDRLKRVNPANGTVLESILVGVDPARLLFDGMNIWVSNVSNSTISVVRAAGALRGTLLQTLTGNGMDNPRGMAFDGERVLVCNVGDSSVSLFKAADFTPLGGLTVGTTVFPASACSDGVNFWIVRSNSSDIVRF